MVSPRRKDTFPSLGEATVRVVLDALAAHSKRAEDDLEGEERGPSANGALPWRARVSGLEQFSLSPCDGPLKQAVQEDWCAVFDGGFARLGPVSVLVSQGPFEDPASRKRDVAV
jgi:hypothetical protein